MSGFQLVGKHDVCSVYYRNESSTANVHSVLMEGTHVAHALCCRRTLTALFLILVVYLIVYSLFVMQNDCVLLINAICLMWCRTHGCVGVSYSGGDQRDRPVQVVGALSEGLHLSHITTSFFIHLNARNIYC